MYMYTCRNMHMHLYIGLVLGWYAYVTLLLMCISVLDDGRESSHEMKAAMSHLANPTKFFVLTTGPFSGRLFHHC